MIRFSFLRSSIGVVSIGFILAAFSHLAAQNYTGSPVTKDRLLKAVKSRQFSVPILVKTIKTSGTDFEVTPAVERELEAARANRAVIDAARENYRYKGAGRRNVPKPALDTSNENYDQYYYEGLEKLNQIRMASSVDQVQAISKAIIALGNRAISLNRARPEAYTLVGAANVALRNFSEAQKYGQFALDRGGNLAFPVYHLSGTPHIETLYIGKGFVTIESDQKFFQFAGREVSNPMPQQDYMMGNVRVAVFSIMTSKAGRNDIWYFAPGSTGTTGEANMILQLIRNNSLSGSY
jgi:hypothetical protein